MLNSFPDPYSIAHIDVRKRSDADEVPAEVFAAYGLDDAVPTRLTTGSYNVHFMVESERGKFDLRRSNRPGDRSNLRYETEFLSHLRRKGFRHAPAPVATLDGNFNFWLDEGGWTLFEWIEEAAGPPDMTVTEGRIESAAKTLAAIHSAMADFNTESKRGDWPIFATPEEWVERWAPRAQELAVHLGSDGEDFGEFAIQATDQLAEVGLDQLQQFGCHGDYRMRNVRFTGGEISTVFDFDTAMVSTRLFDIGGAVARFSPLAQGTSAPQADVGSGSSFLSAYDAELPLTDYEWTVLPVFIKWRLVRDVTAYFDKWWLNIGDGCHGLFTGAAEELVDVARANRSA